MTRKHQYLLAVLALLLFLRFVWQPVMEWQQSSTTQLTLKQAQLDKINSLLGNSEQVLENQQTTQSGVNAIKSLIPTVNNPEAFRLETQQEFEAIAKQNGLRIEQYRWLNSVRLNQRVTKETLELRLAGSVDEFAALQANIEQRQQLITTERLTVNVRRTVRGKPSGFNGVLQIGFFWELIE